MDEAGMVLRNDGFEVEEVARFVCGEDVRSMLIGTDDEGNVMVREDISGPSALVAYGQNARSLRVRFDASQVEGLLAAVGASVAATSLCEYVADENRDVLDLMDLCDREGIVYQFTSMEPTGMASLRG